MKKSLKYYYSSIHECNIYAWSRARKHGNFSFLKQEHFNTPSNKIPLDQSLTGEETYLFLLSELWHEFGQSKELLKELELRKDLIEANFLFLIGGDPSMKNDIKLIKADLEKLMNESKADVDYDFDKELNLVTQKSGVGIINQKKTSMFTYYGLTRS